MTCCRSTTSADGRTTRFVRVMASRHLSPRQTRGGRRQFTALGYHDWLRRRYVDEGASQRELPLEIGWIIRAVRKALGEARVRPRRQGRWVKRRRPQGQQCERATPGRSVTSATVVIVAMLYPFQSIRHHGERRATRATLTSRLPFVRPSPRCPHTCGIAPGALGVPGDREASSSDPMVASLCSSTKDPARRSPWRRAGCLTQSRRHGPVRSARKR